MKKIVSILSILFIAFSSSFCVFAQETDQPNNKTYYIEEAGMSIDIPKNLKCVTPKTKKDDSFFKDTGSDYNETMKFLKDRQIVADFVDVKTGYEFYVTVNQTKSSIKTSDFRFMTPTQEQKFLSQASGNKFQKELDKSVETGVTSSKIAGFSFFDSCKFLRVNSVVPKDEKNDIATSSALTCANKKMVGITYSRLVKTGEGVSNEQLEVEQQALETIKFDQAIHENYKIDLKKHNTTNAIAMGIGIVLFMGVLVYCIYNTKKKNKNGSSRINPLRR